MMMRICLLPEVEVSHSVPKLMAILLNGHSSICHLQRIRLNFGFFPAAQCTVNHAFPNILIHAFPVVLMFYKAYV